MKLSWFIARHYLLASSRGRLLSFITWVALGGVTVGVTALVLVTGVMTGMQNELRGKILEVTPHVVVQQFGGSLRMENWPEVAETVRSVPGVTRVAPFVLTNVGIATDEDYVQSAVLWGVDPDSTTTEAATPLEEMIKQGSYDLGSVDASELPPILLGSRLAAKMGFFVGDTLTMWMMEVPESHSFMGPLPKVRQFEVSGLLRTGMFEYDMNYAYIALDVAQRLLDLGPDDASGLGVATTDPWDADEIAGGIELAAGPDYYTRDWMEANQALFSALALEKIAMAVILFLIVIVAAFNIVSTLVMVVVDRTREIGILKSMGMNRQVVLRIFMLQGAWIGIVGTLIGATAGIVIGCAVDYFGLIKIPPGVYFVERLPVDLQVTDITTIVLASLLVAFAATIYPALQASRLQPVQAIRHE